MVHCIKTSTFKMEYTESEIDCPSLWENHCHGQFEMIAVVAGDINIVLEGKSYRLTKSQAVIIPPLSYHSVTANENGSYRRITVLFDISAIPDVLQSEFAKDSQEMVIAFSPHIEKLREVCQKGDPPFYAPLIQSLMVQIFYDTIGESKSPTGTEVDVFLQKALQYIDQNLHKKILLDDLAKHTARSKSSFCHLFEQKMHISPKQYILQKKLALANKMINEGTSPIIAAAQVGYENYSNFYRLYRKNWGKSPAVRK